MKRMGQITIQLLMPLFLSACSTVQPSGYLDSYDGLKTVGTLERVTYDESYSLSGKSVLVKNPEADAAALNISSVEANVYAKKLGELLVNSLETSALFAGVSGEGESSSLTDADLVLESKLTRLSGGNGFIRWFFGMGLGNPDVQVEGKLIEQKTGKQVLTFADRRRRGNAWFGFNMSVLDNDKQINGSLKGISKSLSSALKKINKP